MSYYRASFRRYPCADECTETNWWKKGNTVLVIEHNLDVIKLADYIIDMGPEGGRGGGQVLAAGTPEEVAGSKKGYTPKFIKEELEN